MTQHLLLPPVELRARGFEVLCRSFGWVNAVRFIQEYEPSQFDYTAERETILPNWDSDEIVRRLQAMDQKAPD
jgi:hypothetical protein